MSLLRTIAATRTVTPLREVHLLQRHGEGDAGAVLTGLAVAFRMGG